MKVTVDRLELLKSIERVLPCVYRSKHVGKGKGVSSLPVLFTVRIETAASGRKALRVTSTNLEETMWCEIECGYIDAEGCVCVSARELKAALRQWPDGAITLEEETRRGHTRPLLRISSRCGSMTIYAEESAEWPQQKLAPEGEPNAAIVLDRERLCQIGGRVVPFVCTDLCRPVLTGVRFTLEGSRLVVAAADGFRLVELSMIPDQIQTQTPTVATAADGTTATSPYAVTVPAQAILRAAAFFRKHDAKIALRICEDHSLAGVGGGTVFFSELNESSTSGYLCQLIEGAFPPYQRIFWTPDAKTLRVQVKTSHLLNVLAMAAAVRKDGLAALLLTIDRVADPCRMIVAMNKPDVLEMERWLPADFDFGESGLEMLATAVNPSYLIAAVKAVSDGSSTAHIELKDPGAPIQVRSGDCACVVMPMHAGDSNALVRYTPKPVAETVPPAAEPALAVAIPEAGLYPVESIAEAITD